MKLWKPSTLFLTLMFTVMGALLGAAASPIVIPSSAFAQTSSLAQDIVDLAQQEETDQLSSSGADDNTQTDTNTQSFDLDLDQDVEAEVENEAEQAAGNLALQDQDAAQEEDDTTPPTLIVPEDITEEATSSDGAEVSFEVTAEDNVDGTATLDEENTLIQDDDIGGSIRIICDPPSGTTFPIGETEEVQCTARDEAGNTAAASFTVTVQDTTPPEEEEEITTHYDTGLILCNSNHNTPQQCDVPFRVTIETTSVLKVGATVSPEHCSSTNFYVSIDGDEDTFGGTFIGRAGYSALGDDTRTIPPHDFGTVESGSHTLDIWVEGITGGCNQGSLSAWEATLTVITSEPVE